MKNKEKYLDEMLALFNKNEVSCSFKMRHVIESCKDTGCDKCSELFKAWLEKEYIEPEPEINWEEVPYNTKVYVRDDEYTSWKLRTFICYNPKYLDPFICITNTGECALGWKYAKLANEEDIIRYKKVN